MASSGATTTLVYDPLGRLFQTSDGGDITQFLYDGDRLAAGEISNRTRSRYQ